MLMLHNPVLHVVLHALYDINYDFYYFFGGLRNNERNSIVSYVLSFDCFPHWDE